MTSVKEYENKINSIIVSLKATGEDSVRHDKVDTAIKMLNELELPSPRCGTCLHKINHVNSLEETFSCELRLAPRSVRKSSSGTIDFGCNRHSEF